MKTWMAGIGTSPGTDLLLALLVAVLALAALRYRSHRRFRAFEYDVAVLGGGAAGLTAAGLAVSLGAKTVLVERERLGGDCTWTGCIPSKTFLRAARLVQEHRQGGRYGLTDETPDVDFARAMEHVRALRQRVYQQADAPPRFEEMGITVLSGQARFVDPHTLSIAAVGAERTVSARYVILATGARPAAPPIQGLGSIRYHTHETIFELRERPRRLLVVGGGPVGCELAQAFCRLGSDVVLVHSHAQLLAKEDAELCAILRGTLEAEGVRCLHEAEVVRVTQSTDGIDAVVHRGGDESQMRVDAVLIATGRRPDVSGLDLERAGIQATDKGIAVDAHGRTRTAHIYACGDVTGEHPFTHMAEHTAKTSVLHALLRVPARVDSSRVPRCTFTDPELASIGASAADLRARGTAFETYRFPFDMLDRAITDGATDGMIKVFATPRRGMILGACVVGAGAGELLGELALAMRHGISLRGIADTIHPYPTLGLAVRRVADQWYVRRRSRRVTRVLQWVFGTRGTLRDYSPEEIV